MNKNLPDNGEQHNPLKAGILSDNVAGSCRIATRKRNDTIGVVDSNKENSTSSQQNASVVVKEERHDSLLNIVNDYNAKVADSQLQDTLSEEVTEPHIHCKSPRRFELVKHQQKPQ